jgi:hypothetical protein
MIKQRQSFTHYVTYEQIEMIMMQYGITIYILKKSNKYPESILIDTLKRTYILTVYSTKEEAQLAINDINSNDNKKFVENLAGDKINTTKIMSRVFVYSVLLKI